MRQRHGTSSHNALWLRGIAFSVQIAWCGIAALSGCGDRSTDTAAQKTPATRADPGKAPGWDAEVRKRVIASQYRAQGTTGDLTGFNPAHGAWVTWKDRLAFGGRNSSRGQQGATLEVVAFGNGAAKRPLSRIPFAVGLCQSDGAKDEKGDCLRRVEREQDGFVEWSENRPDGIEHGFIVPNRPHHGLESGERLRLEMRATEAKVEIWFSPLIKPDTSIPRSRGFDDARREEA
jgi:hypothetical protein